MLAAVGVEAVDSNLVQFQPRFGESTLQLYRGWQIVWIESLRISDFLDVEDPILILLDI